MKISPCCFAGLFGVILLFEAIGGAYIFSTIQNLERQFQISSKLSGFIVSASDIGYISTAIFIAYFGSRGDRAKWIGFGAILAGLSYLMVASPNFIFSAHRPVINNTHLEVIVSFSFNSAIFPLIAEGNIPCLLVFIRFKRSNSIYSLILSELNDFIKGKNNENELKMLLQTFINNRLINSTEDMKIIRKTAIAPFSFCNQAMNDFRNKIKGITCSYKPSVWGPSLVLIIGLIGVGVSRSMPWSLGIPLLDDTVKKRQLPSYFAGVSTLKILGPVCGFLIGSLCNRIYYNLEPAEGLTANDPAWIGAWWLGFIFIAILFFSFVLSLNSLSFLISWKFLTIFIATYNEISAKRIYLALVFGRIIDSLAFRGYLIFLPKFLESHYGVPQHKVHMLLALFGIVGFATGTITGSIIVRKYKFTGRQAAIFILIFSIMNILVFASKIFLGCHSVVNSIDATVSSQTNHSLTKNCNKNCGCEFASLFPICSESGQAFFSPCHAGCREVNVNYESTDKLEFSSCDCLPRTLLKKEYCKDNCSIMLIIFFIAAITGSFVGGNCFVPGVLLLLRSVPASQRSISLGLQGLLVSLFGTLPSPTIWGVIIDSACLVWNHPCFNEKGACVIYSADALRTRMHLTYIIIRAISLTTDIYVVRNSKEIILFDEKDTSQRQERLEMKSI
ncbi:unnamed protein product [Dracunculus medinensis]|uniref:Kazal-like domain-containing protein n=1 Tax=Dracunculus medinensis TaxID=318479 RepID=A0A0N4UDE7_DRAME|nr:unnamed protein product [Dracunculus medinensis]